MRLHLNPNDTFMPMRLNTCRAGFTSMTQRLDSENELVTSTSDGLVIFWDCDEVNPVQAIDVGSHQKLSCVRISPSGRCGAAAVPHACPPFLLSHLRNHHVVIVFSCWL